MSRRICIVTGTRAEYGLLRGIIEGARDDSAFELQLLVTGTHLSPEFGLTFREIEADDIPIRERVEIILSADTATGVSKAIGLGLIGFSDAFERLKPDIVVVLGDRFEILAAATAALVAGIPIAHIHGGETTEGAFDEAIRHSVTKMAHLHFVAAEPYRDRVIQLGEAPERVFLVGGLGVDSIRRLPLLSQEQLEQSLGARFGARNLLVTFHPPTLEGQSAELQMQALLDALDTVAPDTRVIFTMPNADTGSRSLSAIVNSFSASRANVSCFSSLGQLRYLSCMRYVDGVVGNSSSGLIEAPSFRIGTINIGDRQKGRLKATSVIDCEAEANAISAALSQLYSDTFQRHLQEVRNPYGEGGATDAILDILREHPLDGLLKKRFHDIKLAPSARQALTSERTT